MIHRSIRFVALAALAAVTSLAVASNAAAEPPKPGVVPAPIVVKRTVDEQNADWLRHVYQDVLGRLIDPPALAAFRAQLTGGTTRQQVATTILGSAEYRQQLVSQLYPELLGRPADAGAPMLVTQLANGVAVEAIITTMVASGEYFLRAGGNNDAFVGAVYKDLLKRPIDPQGKAFTQGLFVADHTRREVTQAIVASDEYRRVVVGSFFTRYLRRAADPNALAPFVAMLAQGARREAVIAVILASDEYYARP